MGIEDIINVSEDTFEQDVLAYSQDTPVFVIFWAAWSPDSSVMVDLVRQITRANAGDWRIALVDVDTSKHLTKQLRITNVPAMRAFVQRDQVGGFTGSRSEEYLIEFFEQHTPSVNELLLNKGRYYMADSLWDEALDTYAEILENKPKHPEALLNKIRCLIATGQGDEAVDHLKTFPVSPEFKRAEELFGAAVALSNYTSGSFKPQDELGFMYERSLLLITKGNLPAALDGLLAVLRDDKNYLNGEVKNVMIGLLDVIREDVLSYREYQRELAAILF